MLPSSSTPPEPDLSTYLAIFATASPPISPALACFFTSMLQNSGRNADCCSTTPTANVTTLFFYLFFGLFFSILLLLRPHATIHTRQTFGSNGLYPKRWETGSEVRGNDAEDGHQKDWTLLTSRFLFFVFDDREKYDTTDFQEPGSKRLACRDLIG